MSIIPIDSRLEMFVDDVLIESLTGQIAQRMHHPIPANVALEMDQPWEQAGHGYITVFEDDGLFRMYYKGVTMRDLPPGTDPAVGQDDVIVCYAQSADGIHWEKPELGLFSFNGSKKNNIVWLGKGSHGFAPFKDTRPGCPPSERYKAFGRSRLHEPQNPPEDQTWRSLFTLTSADGIHWVIKPGPKRYGAILSREDGYFDSQNVGFWDEEIASYRLYFRKHRPVATRTDLAMREDGDGVRTQTPKIRDVVLATSTDFTHWDIHGFLDYPNSPDDELYTSQITPYPRAPHIMLGFPARYVENRGPLTPWHVAMEKQKPGRYYRSYTDGLLMSSRDGRTFHRWREAFLKSGMPELARWGYGECYMNWGIIQTPTPVPDGPKELSFFISEGYQSRVLPVIRRHTLRAEGFVSIQAGADGGELITPLLTFQGSQLRLNMSTSAAGCIQVEIQDESGKPMEGFALENCHPQFGNALDHLVTWEASHDVARLAGQPVRLRFFMQDADLFALQFV